jgi:EpsI family protein
MVSSMNVLVTNDDPVWAKVAGGTREISFNQQPIQVSTTQLRGPGNTRLVVWQWYWVNGQWTSSDALVKAYTALSRLSGKGDDSAVIVLYAPQGQAGEGDAALADFARAAGPADCRRAAANAGHSMSLAHDPRPWSRMWFFVSTSAVWRMASST